MQWLAALSVRRPVFATVLILSLTVVGVFSFTLLGVDRFPKVDIPTILVTTVQPGAAPEQIETEISDKIEEAVNTISGIDELRSISSEGVSQVVITFLLDKDTNVAAQEVRDKVNGVLPLLPKTIQQPRVDKFDPDAAPVLSVALTANKPVRDITEYADKVLRRQIESVTGVGQVLVLGGRQRQINVWLDADRLRAYNLTVTDVSRALQTQNIETPGGRVDQGPQSITLRTRGRVAERRRVRRRRRARDGRPSRPRQRRRARRGRRGRSEHGRQHQRHGHRAPADPPAVGHQHGRSRESGERTARRAQGRPARRLQHARRARHVRLHRSVDPQRRGTSRRRIDSRRARRAAVPRQLRSTIISAIAIPTSIIATFGLIWYMGFTLNSLTMLALTLSVGIVIDDAIVVLENIYRFIEEKHEHAAKWRPCTRRRRSAWPCSPPRCRSSRSSCRSASWAASSAAS